jgi:hypothetical protein
MITLKRLKLFLEALQLLKADQSPNLLSRERVSCRRRKLSTKTTIQISQQCLKTMHASMLQTAQLCALKR